MRTGGLALALLASYAAASSGDRAPEYAYCVSYCQMNQCPGTDAQQVVKTPFSHWFTRWTCADECKYNCMHQITDRDVADGGKVHQYFGKWPFWQYAGMQEPASVLFSLFNLWAHARGRKMIREVVPERHPMKAYYMTWGLLSMNAWFWSAVFHTRGMTLRKLTRISLIFGQINGLPKGSTTSPQHSPLSMDFTTRPSGSSISIQHATPA